MSRQAHRTVVLYADGKEIDRGSAVRIASRFYDPRSHEQADHSRLVARLDKNQKVDIAKDGLTYHIGFPSVSQVSLVEKYEKAKRLRRLCNREANAAAKERRKYKKGSPDWMDCELKMLKAQAGVEIAKEWMEKYKDGDMTENHKEV